MKFARSAAVFFLTLFVSAAFAQQSVPIGVLIPMTGDGSAEAPYLRNAVEIAFEEINAMLADAGNDLTFDLLFEDTRTSPEGGLEAIESVASAGARIVIGPYSSGASSGARAYANSNEVLIVSPSSTSPALAIPDDYLFRLVTPDTLQADAMAQFLSEEGIDEVIIFHRGDSYGEGLALPLAENFEERGGSATLLAFDPDVSDYATEVSELAREARRLPDNGAIMLIAFQPDGLNILGHARLDPTLGDVRWFGSKDALSPTYFPPEAPEEVAAFMADVSLTGFMPTSPSNPVRAAFEEKHEELHGSRPSPWALYMYDAAWIAALSVITADEYDGAVLREVVPHIASRYIGASGHKLLNEDGDSSVGIYELLSARETADGTFEPVAVGTWDSGTGVLNRFE